MTQSNPRKERFWLILVKSIVQITWIDRFCLVFVVFILARLFWMFITGRNFGGLTHPVPISPPLMFGLALLAIFLGAWAHTLFYPEYGQLHWTKRIAPTQFNKFIIVVPTLLVMACCLLVVCITLAFALDLDALFGFVAPLVLVSYLRSHQKVVRFIFEHAKAESARANVARIEATEAHMVALRSQMNPHFLFNSLNTIASLVGTSGEEAEKAIENLALVLRRTLNHTNATFCKLSEELEYTEAYLAVERVRLADRLEVTWKIEPGIQECWLPTMILQPLVENALQHGIGNLIDGGFIHIQARKLDADLELTVSDNGQGLTPGWTENIGLSNLRERLTTLYAEEATLELGKMAQGTRVVIRLPRRQSAPEEWQCAS